MKKMRGFKISKRFFRISRWILRKARINRSIYRRLPRPGPDYKPRPISKLLSWACRLTYGGRLFCSAKPGSGYFQLGHDPNESKPNPVPKGHLAIYVGQKDDDFHRVHVPVIYFNHPLFGELLKEAEEKYGFCQQGGLTIPCPFSDFERVQTRIESGSGYRKILWRRRR